MVKTLMKQIKEYKKDSLLTMLFATVEVILEIIIPLLMASLIAVSYTHLKDISIKMPDGVPSGVADSFSSLLPTGIIIPLCASIYAICHFIFNTTFAELIYSVIQIPLQGITAVSYTHLDVYKRQICISVYKGDL